MSLFSAFILPQLEKEIMAQSPAISAFLLSQVKNVAAEIIEWAEKKTSIDLNGDGVIGDAPQQ